MRLRPFTILLVCLLALESVCIADLRLPAIFGEHMVVQRDKPLHVWGWGTAGEVVNVALADHNFRTTVGADGKWSLNLPPTAAGGPYTLSVKQGTDILSVPDVLVGEVWLCSGQSNMAMTVNRAQEFEAEQAAATHPTIRMFKTGGKFAIEPQDDCTGTWTVCSPETVGGFSATAYFFARELQQTLNVPVGLINSSVGGTPIEAWIPEEAQRSAPQLREYVEAMDKARAEFDVEAAKAKYEVALEKWKETAKAARAEGKAPPRAPQDPVAQLERKFSVGQLYNGMIAPVIPSTIRGCLWYQGEANSTEDKAGLYQYQLPVLVTEWRKINGGGELPFAWVQLPNFQGSGRNWPMVREAMMDALYLPGTGMAVTMDVGETKDIHPKNKQAVGKRLALWAASEVYDINADKERTGGGSPAYVEHEIEANRVRVKFSHAGTAGLSYSPYEARLSVAAIAGEDGVWHPATITECDGDTITFMSAAVKEPVSLRYLWANDPVPSIRNADGIPASPFRTDDLEAVAPFDAN